MVSCVDGAMADEIPINTQPEVFHDTPVSQPVIQPPIGIQNARNVVGNVAQIRVGTLSGSGVKVCAGGVRICVGVPPPKKKSGPGKTLGLPSKKLGVSTSSKKTQKTQKPVMQKKYATRGSMTFKSIFHGNNKDPIDIE